LPPQRRTIFNIVKQKFRFGHRQFNGIMVEFCKAEALQIQETRKPRTPPGTPPAPGRRELSRIPLASRLHTFC